MEILKISKMAIRDLLFFTTTSMAEEFFTGTVEKK
jgi:hypothetical protein